MLLKKIGRLDRVVLLIACLALLAAGTAIVFDNWLFQLSEKDLQRLSPIGQVTVAKNDVRRRVQVRFSWMPLKKTETVFHGDSIFTGPDSHAIITTMQGDQLEIAPNSLVVINAKEQSILLDVNFGSIQGRLARGSKLLVSSMDGQAEFDESESDSVIQVDVKRNENPQIQVLQGEVKLKNDETKHAKNLKQDVLESLGSDPKVNIQLTGPLVNAQVEGWRKEAAKLNFEWKSNTEFSRYRVQVSEDAQFGKILLEKASSLKKVALPPELPHNKRLFWRVTAQNNFGEREIRSQPSELYLVGFKAPLLIHPLRDDLVGYEMSYDPNVKFEEGARVNLQWQPQSPAQDWEVQVAKDDQFTTPVFNAEVKQVTTTTELLGPGRYFWRVRAKNIPQSPWSAVNPFEIALQDTKKLAAPSTSDGLDFLITTQPNGLNINELRKIPAENAHGYMAQTPQLSWQEIPGSRRYNIQFASDPGFKQLVQQSESPTTQYSWRDVAPGNYYWRVQAANNRARSPFSEPQEIRVRLAPPMTQTPESFVQPIDDFMVTPPAAAVELKWTPTLFTSKFEVQWDRSPKFPKPLVLKTPHTEQKVQLDVPGQYYWRVRALNENGQPISDFSPVIPFEFKREIKDNQKLAKLRPISPTSRETLSFIGRGDSLIFFRWTTPFSSGTLYEIQVSDAPDFSTVRIQKVTSDGWFRYAGDLPDGWWYWRIRATGIKSNSDWSAPSVFRIDSPRSAAVKMPPALPPAQFANTPGGSNEPAPVAQQRMTSSAPMESLTPGEIPDPSRQTTASTATPTSPGHSAQAQIPGALPQDPLTQGPLVSPIADPMFGAQPDLMSPQSQGTPIPLAQPQSAPVGQHQPPPLLARPDANVNQAGEALAPVEIVETLPSEGEMPTDIEVAPAPVVEAIEPLEYDPEREGQTLPEIVTETKPVNPTGKKLVEPTPSLEKTVPENLPNLGKKVVDQLPPTGRKVVDQLPPTGRKVTNQLPASGKKVVNQGPPSTGKNTEHQLPPSGKKVVGLSSQNSGKKVVATPSLSKKITIDRNPLSAKGPLETPKVKDQQQNFAIQSVFGEQLLQDKMSPRIIEKIIGQLKAHPVFEWNSVPFATSYFFELAEDKYFNNILVGEQVSAPQYTWLMVRPGTFYWRVKAIGLDTVTSNFSAAQTVKVSVAPPVSLTPNLVPGGEGRKPASLGEFTVRWAPVPFATKYELEFATDIEFKEKKTLSSDDFEKKIKVSEPGIYFWRVRPLDRQNRVIGEFSPPHALEVLRQDPINDPSQPFTAMTPTPGYTVRLAEDEKAMIPLRWVTTEPKKSYYIEVDRNKKFNDPIVRRSVNKPEHLIHTHLPEGEFYWRVGVDVDGGLRWSPVFKFKIERLSQNSARKPTSK